MVVTGFFAQCPDRKGHDGTLVWFDIWPPLSPAAQMDIGENKV